MAWYCISTGTGAGAGTGSGTSTGLQPELTASPSDRKNQRCLVYTLKS